MGAYSIHQETGRLTLVGHYSSGGNEPCAFDIDAAGQYLIVADVFSNTVSQYKRNLETGTLTPAHVALQISLPTDINFFRNKLVLRKKGPKWASFLDCVSGHLTVDQS
ncbi:lactonase family protein [Acinetobacter sp. ANC 3813]|uniref:lactonase family protein n=1 Tax=Acinetobacter sp. ANC 3813 TaxID=1977873 RepID=UPI000A35B649|nr:hypothetical protein B9T34_12555 [Acinetobacter sp. ANC 3813]